MPYIFLLFLAYQETPSFIIYYQPKDSRVANEILKFAEQELPRISKDMGCRDSDLSESPTPEQKIHIHLISLADEIKKIQGFPDWGIGCATPPEKLIIIKSPRIVKYPVNLKTLIAHELAHIVLGNRCKNIRIPRWFDEGIAMYESREWELSEGMWLSWANFTNSILPLSSIEKKFPKDSKKARLAYVESFSAISFTINEFGKDALEEIIQNMEQTSSFEQSIKNTLGISYLDFISEWKKWVEERYKGFNALFNMLFPGALLLLIFFIAVIMKKRQKKKLSNNLEM